MSFFGQLPVADALGKTLVHAVKTASGRIAKGTILTGSHLDDLARAGIETLTVAQFDANDIREDAAAAMIAESLCGDGLRAAKPVTGRVNLFASRPGLLRVDAQAIATMNRALPAIGIATLGDQEQVSKGRLVATAKVIPFAVPEQQLAACTQLARPICVSGYSRRRCVLIQTTLPAIADATLDKTRRVTDARLAQLACEIVAERRCGHATQELSAAIHDALAAKPDLLLVSCATAVCDERDVLPAAIAACSGEIVRVGLPVDPGNLLLLGRIGAVDLIGLPGCARSPKFNGIDKVLRRICAGYRLDADDLADMGVGGLLEEIHERPQSRLQQASGSGGIAAVLLAAGLSSRMGARCKLVEKWHGAALIEHVAQTLRQAVATGLIELVVVVTGYQRDRIEKLLGGYDFQFVHNNQYRAGMATSLGAGISALAPDTAGAFVCLGDMPLVTVENLTSLRAAFAPETGHDLVVPVHKARRGHPVLFGARHFESFASLEGDTGARSIIDDNAQATVFVEAGPEITVDFDDEQAFSRA